MINKKDFQKLKVELRELCFKFLGDDDQLFTSRMEDLFEKYDKNVENE